MGLVVTAHTNDNFYVNQERQMQLALYINQNLGCAIQSVRYKGHIALYVDTECPLVISEIKKLNDIKIIVDIKEKLQ